MKEIGTVLTVDSSGITVSVKKTGACASCDRCSHAHISFGDNQTLIVRALPVGDIKPGDRVELEITGRDYIKLSFFMYMLPVIASLAGFGLGWLLGGVLGHNVLWGTVFSLGSLGLSFLWVHYYDKSAEKTGRYLPIARPFGRAQW